MRTGFFRGLAAVGLLVAGSFTASAQVARPQNIFQAIFGTPRSEPTPSRDFMPPPAPVVSALPRGALPTEAHKKAAAAGGVSRAYGGGGSQAVCVRTCDGFFFPVNYEGARGNDRYQEACQASCPNAETEVYFMPPGADLTRAANAKGRNYSQLPNAFKYRQQRDESCSCKGAQQTWAEAIGPAEALIRHNKNDIIVTQERSDQSVRPQEPATAARTTKDKLASAAALRPAAE